MKSFEKFRFNLPADILEPLGFDADDSAFVVTCWNDVINHWIDNGTVQDMDDLFCEIRNQAILEYAAADECKTIYFWASELWADYRTDKLLGV